MHPRLVTDRTAITAELKDEKSRRVEFFSGATDVLSALDNIGYKVRLSGQNLTEAYLLPGHIKLLTCDRT